MIILYAFQSFAELQTRMDRILLRLGALLAVICCANGAGFLPFLSRFLPAITTNKSGYSELNIDFILGTIFSKTGSAQKCSKCDMYADLTADLTDFFSQNAHQPIGDLVKLHCVKA